MAFFPSLEGWGERHPNLATEYRQTDPGDHTVSIPGSYATGLTDTVWTSYWPNQQIALDREGVFQNFWGLGSQYVLTIPSAYKACMLVASTIASQTIGAFRGLEPLPTPAVLAEPSPGEGRQTTVADWVVDLLLNGNAFGLLSDRDSRGYVTSIIPLPADNVSVTRVDGRVTYLIGPPEIAPELRIVAGREDVFHAKGFGRPGTLRGRGVLETHTAAIDMAVSQMSYSRRAFDAGVPSGIIKIAERIPDQTKAKARAQSLKDAWMAANTGKREPAVLTEGIDFTPLSWNPSDMAVGEIKNLTDLDMARIFGVAGFWVDAVIPGSTKTYQNVTDAATNFQRFSLEFWTSVLETEMSRLLPRGTDARFNRDSILRPPMKERAEIYQIAAPGVPWLKVEEIRASENLPPLEDGDPLLEPQQAPSDVTTVNPSAAFPADQQAGAQTVAETGEP